jgi:hypothetical protein
VIIKNSKPKKLRLTVLQLLPRYLQMVISGTTPYTGIPDQKTRMLQAMEKRVFIGLDRD